MKLIIQLSAAADCAWDNKRANYTLASRIRNACKKHRPDSYNHDSNEPPMWCFTLPKWREDGYRAGDTAYVVLSSVNKDVLEAMSIDLQSRPELGLGEMIFDVEQGWTENNTVRVGESGKIRTRSGCLVKTDWYNEVYWTEEDGMNTWRQRVEENIHQKMLHSDKLEENDYSDEPIKLFDSHELMKTYACPKQITEDHTQTFIFSKVCMDYNIRDKKHRDYLNVALNAGIGAKNSYGFGFLDKIDKHTEYSHDTATKANAEA